MKKALDIFRWILFTIYSIKTVLVIIFELIIASGIMIAAKIFRDKKVFQYGLNVALSMDQWASVQFLGHPDETISSRLGRAKIHGHRYWWVKVLQVGVDFVSKYVFGQSDHCVKSVIEQEQLAFKEFDYELWSWSKEV